MEIFGEAFRKQKVDNLDEEKPLPPSLPGPSSYIPFLGPETITNKKERPKTKPSEAPAKQAEQAPAFISQYIITPPTPPVTLAAPECSVTAPQEETGTDNLVLGLPESMNQYSCSTLTRKQKKNQKRNRCRRGENRDKEKAKKGIRATEDIDPKDPYWAPALENAAVAISAPYVNRNAKMSDGADVRVRSYADGSIIAIRNNVQVILMGPTRDN